MPHKNRCVSVSKFDSFVLKLLALFFSLSLSFGEFSFRRVFCLIVKMNSIVCGRVSFSCSGRVSPRGVLWSPGRGFMGRARSSTPVVGFLERTPPPCTTSVSPIWGLGPDVPSSPEEFSWDNECDMALMESITVVRTPLFWGGDGLPPDSICRRLAFGEESSVAVGGPRVFSVTPPIRSRHWRVTDTTWTGIKGYLKFNENGEAKVVPGRGEYSPFPLQRTRDWKLNEEECASARKRLFYNENAWAVGCCAGLSPTSSPTSEADESSIPWMESNVDDDVSSTTAPSHEASGIDCPVSVSPAAAAVGSEATVNESLKEDSSDSDEESTSDSWLYKEPGFAAPAVPDFLWKGMQFGEPETRQSPEVDPAPRVPFRIHEDGNSQNFDSSTSAPTCEDQQSFGDSEVSGGESSYVCDRSSCHERLVKRLIYGTISTSPCQGRLLARQQGNEAAISSSTPLSSVETSGIDGASAQVTDVEVPASISPVEIQRCGSGHFEESVQEFEVLPDPFDHEAPSGDGSVSLDVSPVAASPIGNDEVSFYIDVDSSFEETYWDANSTLFFSLIDDEDQCDAGSSFGEYFSCIECISIGTAPVASTVSEQEATDDDESGAPTEDQSVISPLAASEQCSPIRTCWDSVQL